MPRITRSWPHAIAHVDCDAFYAACEIARRPDLAGRPVCVLSSQDAIVVAKSYDAKRLGITTGMPVWEARRLVPRAEFLAADFRYYGQISGKVFEILHRYSPTVEIYSIDEAFIDMDGIRTLWRKSFAELADDIRHHIRSETGITASVGISLTRTLAKMASESNKPDGTTIVPGRMVDAFLRDQPVAAIPGIGRNRAALLQKFGIITARQLAGLEEAMLERLLGRHGLQLKQELSGRSVFGVESKPKLPRSLARTATMGEITGSRERLAAHLAWHATRLVSELVAKRLTTRQLHIFLTLASFERRGMPVRLARAGNGLQPVMAAAKQAMRQLFREGERYRGCGIVAGEIGREEMVQADLFARDEAGPRQTELVLTMNRINRRFGHRTLSPASVHTIRARNRAWRFRYPVIIAGD